MGSRFEKGFWSWVLRILGILGRLSVGVRCLEEVVKVVWVGCLKLLVLEVVSCRKCW